MFGYKKGTCIFKFSFVSYPKWLQEIYLLFSAFSLLYYFVV
jgi:hypothetical protein